MQAEQEEKATDYVALQSLQERQAELEAALEEKMERWIYLNDLAEQIPISKGRRARPPFRANSRDQIQRSDLMTKFWKPLL